MRQMRSIANGRTAIIAAGENSAEKNSRRNDG